MGRLAGNTILVVENDESLRFKLQEVIESRGGEVITVNSLKGALRVLAECNFDLIISTYYLPDGLIQQIIDWCRQRLDPLPLFVALGTGLPSDGYLLKRQLISEVFSKLSQPDKIIDGIENLVFDFDSFKMKRDSANVKNNLNVELIIQDQKSDVDITDILDKGIYIKVSKRYSFGTFAILRITFLDSENFDHVTMVGSMDEIVSGGQLFRINEHYGKTWLKLLQKLNERQLGMSNFYAKTADK